VVASAVATTATAAATPVSLALASTTSNRVAVVEIPDDDAPPHGWGQWENWPASAPEPAAGVLVMREDGCVMLRRPAHGAEASSSCAVLPAPDVVVAPP
jgi:hypothetical protein